MSGQGRHWMNMHVGCCVCHRVMGTPCPAEVAVQYCRQGQIVNKLPKRVRSIALQ